MHQLTKYANRRLYDPQTSAYITLEGVRLLIVAGETIAVSHHKTGANLTREVLLDVLKACEMKDPRLPLPRLAQLIRAE